MEQKGLHGDGTANLLCRLSRDAASLCRQRPHGMNAGDGYCGSSYAMTDLVLPKVSVYQAQPDTPNPESRIWSEQ